MKKAGLFILIILVMTVLVAGKEIPKIEVSKPVLINDARQGQPAYFEFTIKNNQAFGDILTIKPDELFVSPISKIFSSVVLTPNQLEIGSFKEKNVKAEVILFDDAEPNKNYVTQIIISSIKDSLIQETLRLTVNLFASDDIFELTSIIPESGVVPGIGVPIKIQAKNKLNSYFKDIEIKIEIEGKNFNDKAIETLTFDKSEVKTKEVLFNFGSSASPGTYTIKISAFDDDNLKGYYEGSFEVVPNFNIEEKIEKDSGFLKSTTIVKKKNNGNLPVEESYQLKKKFIGDLFLKSNVERKVVGDKNVWLFLIKPEQEFTLIIERNYRTVFLGLLISILVIIVLYYSLKKEIKIKKSLIKIKEYQNTVEIKVLIQVENTLKKDIENLKIVDIVPHLVKPTGDFSTLKPSKIVRGETGIKLIWDIPVLTGKEERILGYRATTRLNVVGRLDLPAAAVLYEYKNKTLKIKSNRLVLNR